MASKEEHTKSESLQSRVEEQIASVDRFVDRGLSAASDALRSSTAIAKEEIEKTAGVAKVRSSPYARLFPCALLENHSPRCCCFSTILWTQRWYLGTRHGLQLVDETLIGYLRGEFAQSFFSW
jgi:hypothetical protein